MTVRTSRERLNPIDLLLAWPAIWGPFCVDRTKHITYDPHLRRGDYYIIRQETTDGTWYFRTETIKEILRLLVGRSSYLKTNEPDWSTIKDIRYTIGPLTVVTIYGRVDLPVRSRSYYGPMEPPTLNIAGQRQRFRLPVKVEYIY